VPVFFWAYFLVFLRDTVLVDGVAVPSLAAADGEVGSVQTPRVVAATLAEAAVTSEAAVPRGIGSETSANGWVFMAWT
jgi:hypothetical protein